MWLDAWEGRRCTRMNADFADPSARSGAPSAQVTGRILQAFFEVHWEIGHGYLEVVYVRALRIALADLQLLAEAEARIPVHFRGRIIGCFRADLLVERSVIVEVKAVRELEHGHTAQLLNYLRASDFEIGLLLNFGSRATFKRLVFGNDRKFSLRSSAYVCGPQRSAASDPRDPRLPSPSARDPAALDAPPPHRPR